MPNTHTRIKTTHIIFKLLKTRENLEGIRQRGAVEAHITNRRKKTRITVDLSKETSRARGNGVFFF